MSLQATILGAALMSIAAAAPSTIAAEGTDDPIISSSALKAASGEEIYRRVCQGCHMPDGRGAQGAGTYPALAENPHLASAAFTAATVALGRRNMPHFAPQPELGGFEAFVTLHLDDAQIAAVVNYVRSHFGNRYTDELTEADVKALHP
ncbi:MAG TPA: cytochrome c [Rhodanobacteraceae bacterium]|nr:cytochrome c [Rhodanobacteraceae bacterium]